VGDPQQLPATILSQRGKDLLFERSLFERLQQGGCPVHMLQVLLFGSYYILLHTKERGGGTSTS